MKKRHGNFWDFLIDIILVLIGGGLGYYLMPLIWQLFRLADMPLNNTFINILIGLFISVIIIYSTRSRRRRFYETLERQIQSVSLVSILMGCLGMVLGLIIASLINVQLQALHLPFISNVLPIIVTITLAMLGYYVAQVKREDIKNIGENIKAMLEGRHKGDEEDKKEETQQKENEEVEDELVSVDTSNPDVVFQPYKILDTSVIIDGRILDVLKTGFIEGVIVIPNFVLKELQYIADSADSTKRVRGRRGLDILNQIRDLDNIKVEFYEGDFDEEDVDLKLLLLAKEINGVVVTNDYNLNKVSHFHQIKVLNINELANALKTVVVPGDIMNVHIIKPGTERQQGVGYLDDGTMIVVEEGRKHIDETLTVEVTSAIQTNAGKMIFAKIAGEESETTDSQPEGKRQKSGKRPKPSQQES